MTHKISIYLWRCVGENPKPSTAAQDVGRAAQPASVRIAGLDAALDLSVCEHKVYEKGGQADRKIYGENYEGVRLAVPSWWATEAIGLSRDRLGPRVRSSKLGRVRPPQAASHPRPNLIILKICERSEGRVKPHSSKSPELNNT